MSGGDVSDGLHYPLQTEGPQQITYRQGLQSGVLSIESVPINENAHLEEF